MSPLRTLRMLVVLLGLLPLAALGDYSRWKERIEDYAVELTVAPDGVLLVTERITVQAAGEQIKRGIYRDFPVRSILWHLLNKRVGFEVLGVSRDGEPEPYFIEPQNAVRRVYIGRAERLLPSGRHQYEIRYRSDRQLLHRAGEDELYWNVTGNDWQFPILQASIAIHLPEGVQPTAVQGYTGSRGQQGQDYRQLPAEDASLRLATTRPLGPGEGFTIAVAWPDGLVQRPSTAQRLAWLLQDNHGVAVGAFMLLGLLAFYYWHWRRVGRDPERGLVVPLFEAPAGLSPAAVGFIWHRGFREGYSNVRALTVALTSMAIKRVLKLEDGRGGGFDISRGQPGQRLFSGEQAVFDALFDRDNSAPLRIKSSYEPRLAKALGALGQTLQKEHHQACFRLNRGIWWLGLLWALPGCAATLLVGLDGASATETVMVALVFLLVFGVPALTVMAMLLRHLRSGRGGFGSLLGLLFTAPFLIPVVAALWFMNDVVAPASVLLLAALILCCVLFRAWLEAPTMQGRRLLDQIEGYRDYLALAESETLALAGRAPAMSIALYEQHLPYAMALGVERQWSARFDQALSSGLVAPSQGSSYRPDWYHSTRAFSSPTALSDSLASGLASAAASASTAPSSASSSGGSSGGGSSGGGGGGGGGGGW